MKSSQARLALLHFCVWLPAYLYYTYVWLQFSKVTIMLMIMIQNGHKDSLWLHLTANTKTHFFLPGYILWQMVWWWRRQLWWPIWSVCIRIEINHWRKKWFPIAFIVLLVHHILLRLLSWGLTKVLTTRMSLDRSSLQVPSAFFSYDSINQLIFSCNLLLTTA